jgi:hypothetical protein
VKTIRELSVAGPCVTLGFVLGETDWRISYRDRHGTPKFISRRWAVHTEQLPDRRRVIINRGITSRCLTSRAPRASLRHEPITIAGLWDT